MKVIEKYNEEIKKAKENGRNIIACLINNEVKSLNYDLKEKDKLERKIKKVEEEISIKEEKIEKLKLELTKEDVYSDYVKVGEIQERIKNLNEELEKNMIEWEMQLEELEKIKEYL